MKNWHSDTTGEMIATARSFYERSIAADAHYAPPVHGLAHTFLTAWLEPWQHNTLVHEYQKHQTLDHALLLAQRAVELEPNLADTHLQLAHILKWQHRREECWAEYELAFELNPNLPDYRYGLALIHSGRTEEGIEHLKRIIRLKQQNVIRVVFRDRDTKLAEARLLTVAAPISLTAVRYVSISPGAMSYSTTRMWRGG
jgi:tetratricopeptide (TPR) repeat protein